MNTLNDYVFSIESSWALSSLEKDWLSLEGCVEPSFFLTWGWIKTWLDSYSPDIKILRVKQGDQLVSLGLFVLNKVYQWKRFPSQCLYLHQTGQSHLDQIWIEYNELLCLPNHKNEVYSKLVPFLAERVSGWDQFQIGAVSKKTAQLLSDGTRYSRLDLWCSPSFGVNLKQLSNRKIDYLESLSRNTRYQIRRSLKLYSSMGELELTFAQTVEEALAFFSEVAPLHIARWGKEPGQSGFANPAFVLFHNKLIALLFDKRQIDLIQVKSGTRVLGYLYNFLHRGRVYFYLSGLASESDSKLKPGLCAHALVIQHYLDKGYDFYDFMGGEDRYKLNLGEVHEELYQISLQKPLLKFKIESFLRRVKQHFSS